MQKSFLTRLDPTFEALERKEFGMDARLSGMGEIKTQCDAFWRCEDDLDTSANKFVF